MVQKAFEYQQIGSTVELGNWTISLGEMSAIALHELNS
jgi:hypothetical protein